MEICISIKSSAKRKHGVGAQIRGKENRHGLLVSVLAVYVGSTLIMIAMCEEFVPDNDVGYWNYRDGGKKG